MTHHDDMAKSYAAPPSSIPMQNMAATPVGMQPIPFMTQPGMMPYPVAPGLYPMVDANGQPIPMQQLPNNNNL
jgi:hypothetical protein